MGKLKEILIALLNIILSEADSKRDSKHQNFRIVFGNHTRIYNLYIRVYILILKFNFDFTIQCKVIFYR